MPSIQSLKKQLRGIRSTQKLTKAMKTIATVKFSKLNTAYNQYSEYGRQCKKMFDLYSQSFVDSICKADSDAPVAVIVMASNKGLCGSFNSELLNFAHEELSKFENYVLIACGKKAINFFKSKKIPLEKEYILSDIPSYEESSLIIDELSALRKCGKVSDVYLIYPKYTNIMRQTPVTHELFSSKNNDDNDSVLFVPDRNTIVEKTAKTVFHAMFFGYVLESALGAQAATLMTMRAAYDTATQYRFLLESLINRKRQSAVTADVIETSGERTE